MKPIPQFTFSAKEEAQAVINEIDFFRQILDYNSISGDFKWKKRSDRGKAWNTKHKGKVAGSINGKGYVVININGRKYYAHRLAWLFAHGEWPEKQIDHINRCKNDNAISNLRVVSNKVNHENRFVPRADNRSGFLGVVPVHGRFSAHIKVDGASKYLGTFNTPEKAHVAYVQAKKKMHMGFV